MKKYLYIAIFGFIGAIIRSATYYIHIFTNSINTLIINTIGSFLLAVVLALTFSKHLNIDLRLGISVGFFGAFTTFSTLCKEVYNLIALGEILLAVLYILASVFFGLGAVYAGMMAVKEMS